jgi:hypothetical protein
MNGCEVLFERASAVACGMANTGDLINDGSTLPAGTNVDEAILLSDEIDDGFDILADVMID